LAVGGYRLEFVDREAELAQLQGYAEKGTHAPLLLYGPEGCGKTRLLLELARRLQGREYLVVYVDALEEDSLEAALAAPRWLREMVREAMGELAPGPVGVLASRAVVELLGRLERRRLEGKRVVLLVDDAARPLGLERLEAYVKRLLRLLEHDLPEAGAASALAVLATSEGQSLEALTKHPTWVDARLIWNLPEPAARELATALGAPGSRWPRVYRATGGNPRAILGLARNYSWDPEAWIEALAARLAPLARRVKREGLARRLAEALEDPDALAEPEPEAEKLARLLLGHNLVTPLGPGLAGPPPEPSQELGIGQSYAWQLPALRDALRRALART